MTETKNCRSCRHHSLRREERVLTLEEIENGGEWPAEMASELAGNVVHDGSPDDDARYGEKKFDETFSCVKQGMKLIGHDDTAGVDCPMWEAGKKATTNLAPHLLARLAVIEAKSSDE